MSQVQILWVNRTESSTFLAVRQHSHPFYHAIYIASGEMMVTVAGQAVALKAGEFLLVPKETDHFFAREEDVLADFLEIKFVIQSADLEAKVNLCPVKAWADPVISSLVPKVIQEFMDHRASADEAAASYLQTILYTITGENRRESGAESSMIDTQGLSELSKRIISYLEANTGHDVSLDELAEKMGMCKNYLCNAFRRDTGMTIGNCKNLLRIRKAAELIAYSDISLSAVAEQCGFATVAHFNRVFLKYVGIPPIKCRRAFPADILVYHTGEPSAKKLAVENKFMYNVLAKKQIALVNYKEE